MSSSVTYSAVLDVQEETVVFVSGLLGTERERRGTRTGRRVLDCRAQAVLILRWFLDVTRVRRPAADNAIGVTTACRYLHEGIDVLASHAPGLHGVLQAARQAGYSHVNVDGVVIATDRVSTPGPTTADLWWSGKHKHHGGNVQVLSAPDGWPLWTSGVRPGREHDITCARAHGIIDALAQVTDAVPCLADLGYEGAAHALRIPVKRPEDAGSPTTRGPTTSCCTVSAASANALLIVTFKALRRVSLDPWRIGAITAAALVLLHHENNRTI